MYKKYQTIAMAIPTGIFLVMPDMNVV